MACVQFTALRPAAKLIVQRAVDAGRFEATHDGLRFSVVAPDRARAAIDLDSCMVAIDVAPRRRRRHDDYSTNRGALPDVDRLSRDA